MDALYWRMPAGRLGVPTADFAAVLNAVAARFRANQSDRFAAGALNCGRWIAGITDTHPISGAQEACTAKGMTSCQMTADAVVYGWDWAPSGIDQRWARGVAAMVAWARGAERTPPVPAGSAG